MSKLKFELTGKQVKMFRKRLGWSAYELGREMGGYSRSYIKHIEGGSLKPSARFYARFQRLAGKIHKEDLRNKVIQTRFRLPRVFEISVKPRRCPGCRKWYIWNHPNRKYCDAECRRHALARAKV